MRFMHILASIMFLLVNACGNKDRDYAEVFQKERVKIVDVSERIVSIKTDYVIGKAFLYIIDDILIAEEFYPKGENVDHLFDLNTFRYISSTGVLGRGPGEITIPSGIYVDSGKRIFWQLDVGKKLWHKMSLDSVLNGKDYMPSASVKLVDTLLLVNYGFLNDSIALGKAIEPFTGSPFVTMAMTKFNINTGEITRFG
jgi:hypothetical protein